MKQIAQYQDGRLEIQEVPRPTLPPNGVLVRTTHSVISVGTEKRKVEQAKMNLLQKARARPDQVQKVLDTARSIGWRNALAKVQNRLQTPTPLGYSAAGIVVEVSPDNTRFRVGDRVACAGAEYAFHAEYLAVPELLAALVPASVPNWKAAYTTVCAIAMQGVRQAEASLGDRVLVMGQGLIGLLVTNVLRTAGVRVMAVDVVPSRRELCHSMGAEKVVILGAQNLADEVRAWTGGFGVDAAIVCTASKTNEPIEQAAGALRDRGTLVDVGITKIELPWNLFYEKELQVRFSRSYGPGRYDPRYEWDGQDYPIGYVRWTEQRNFESCLELMRTGQLNLEALTTRHVPFDQAASVYQDLLSAECKDIGVVLEYPAAQESETELSKPPKFALPFTEPAASEIGITPVSQLDVIGAGNFARTMLLPHLHGKIKFNSVVNQTALSAAHVKTKFGFASASTDPYEVLAAGAGTAALIATRHNLHAPLVKAALAANSHVFVEKPLCLNREELSEIDQAVARTKGSLQVGFNRRFAPATQELRRVLDSAPGPKTVTYRVCAGKLDPSSWYANYSESGGRVLGEACHFLDYFCYILRADPCRVFAQSAGPAAGRFPFPDSVTAQVEFLDGSCGQLIYSAEGDPGFPKETIDVFGTGVVCELINFQQLHVYQRRKRKNFTYSSKGHAEQMQAWLSFLGGEAPHPLPYQESRRTMLLTFAVLDSIRQARAIELIGNNLETAASA